MSVALTTAFAVMSLSLSLLGAISDFWCAKGLSLALISILGQTAAFLLADLVALGLVTVFKNLILNSNFVRFFGWNLGSFTSDAVCK